MKNNQTRDINRVRAAARISNTTKFLTPSDIKNVENLKRYYENKRIYPDMMRKKREREMRLWRRECIICSITPIIIRILMVIIGYSITMAVTDWADRVLFDYDIIYTLAFCGTCGILFVLVMRILGEWVIYRFRYGYWRGFLNSIKHS